ncbi:conserved hypothetical protein [Frigoribacterium sp. 9N]|nr:conserved hypothetical protein [Frigoribacterium sp. 9N]
MSVCQSRPYRIVGDVPAPEIISLDPAARAFYGLLAAGMVVVFGGTTIFISGLPGQIAFGVLAGACIVLLVRLLRLSLTLSDDEAVIRGLFRTTRINREHVRLLREHAYLEWTDELGFGHSTPVLALMLSFLQPTSRRPAGRGHEVARRIDSWIDGTVKRA